MLGNYKKITTKIGSNVLLGEKSKFNETLIEELAQTIQTYSKNNYRFSIVTSGAIGLGNKELGLEKSPVLSLNQAAAGVGNRILFQKYGDIFADYGIQTAPLLVGADDFRDKIRRKNFKNTRDTFFDLGIVPIINENDTFRTEEIKFGDNDALGAIIGNETSSEQFIILSNIDGLYSNMENKSVISYVDNLHSAKQYVCDEKSSLGTGGMISKLFAASIFSNQTILANGRVPNILEKILNNSQIGTKFELPQNQKDKFIRQYIQENGLGLDLETYLLSHKL